MDTSPNSSWFYAQDDSQQGPIPFSELQEKFQSGLKDSTLVWNEKMTDWIPAKEIPGLTTSYAAQSDSPYAAPATDVTLPPLPTISANDSPPEIPIPLDIGFCIRQGWKHTLANFGPIFLIGLVYFTINFLFGVVSVLLESGANTIDEPGGSSVGLVAVQAVTAIIEQILSIFLGLGLTHFGLKLLRGDDARTGDLFSQGPKLLRAIGAGILYILMVALGFVFLIVPGIYLAIRFSFYQTAIVEKDLGIFESFEYSSRLTRENKLPLLGLAILSFLIVLAGLLALLVGLLWAAPTAWLAYLIAYRFLHSGQQSIKVLT